MIEFENFGFYTIDANYLEYLNSKNDSYITPIHQFWQ